MQSLLRDIHVGMTVFDNHHNHIGTIDDLKFPENAGAPDVVPADIDGGDKRGRETILGAIADAFAPDELPETLRDRLLREGYIRLDADGLFAADRYILPSQIASASGDEVMLNVEKDQLIKRH
jgi:hypothetical protein